LCPGGTQGLVQAGADLGHPEVDSVLAIHDRVLEGQGLVCLALRKVCSESSSQAHPCRLEDS